MSTLKGYALVMASILAFANGANAAPITGELGFVGWGYSLLGGTRFSDSTGLDFATGTELVTGGMGDYGSVPSYTLATFINGLTFNPFPSLPQIPLWSFTSNGRVYSFDLSDLTVATQTATELVLTGQGKLNITGFDATDGNWSFTANTQGSVSTFSSGARAVPVAAPEIDATAGIGALTLLAGRVLLLKERMRLRSQRSSKLDK